MGVRRKAREYALQALYLSELTRMSSETALRTINREKQIEADIYNFAEHLTAGTTEHQSALDVLIQKYAKNWELKRMAALDRNILRLGAYELIHELDTPVSVIIDEAVEIAKTFSTDDSGKFVNGILDKIKEERTPSDVTKNGKRSKKIT